MAARTCRARRPGGRAARCSKATSRPRPGPERSASSPTRSTPRRRESSRAIGEEPGGREAAHEVEQLSGGALHHHARHAEARPLRGEVEHQLEEGLVHFHVLTRQVVVKPSLRRRASGCEGRRDELEAGRDGLVELGPDDLAAGTLHRAHRSDSASTRCRPIPPLAGMVSSTGSGQPGPRSTTSTRTWWSTSATLSRNPLCAWRTALDASSLTMTSTSSSRACPPPRTRSAKRRAATISVSWSSKSQSTSGPRGRLAVPATYPATDPPCRAVGRAVNRRVRGGARCPSPRSSS